MSRALVIHGSGGHGKVVADAALSAGWNVLGFSDEDPGKAGAEVLGLPVVAIGLDQAIAHCRAHHAAAVVAIGDNRARQRVFEALGRAGAELATIVHRAAVVAPSARLGAGTVVFAGAVINPDAWIGDDVIINTGASVDHDNVIGDHAHIAPGVHTGGTVRVGTGAMLGVGAQVRNDLAIGAWSVVGVGAVVVADIPERVVAFGNPARVRRRLD
jgi:sugar O-acyltransferase (sialic acid O-acetyltransferase NeuD family)